MRNRTKKLIATLLVIVMIGQLPGFETVISVAKTLMDGANEVVTVDTASEDYVFSSGGTNSLTIEETISVTGTITDSGNGYAKNTITNYGTTNEIIVNGSATTTVSNYGIIQGLTIEGSGTVTVTGGEIDFMDVLSTYATVTVTGCTIGHFVGEKSVSFEGNNTVSNASLAGVDGTGSLYVTDSLVVNGEYVAMDIAELAVNKETTIMSDKAFSVMCEGKSYAISAGFNSTLLEEYGVTLATSIEDVTVVASSDNPTDTVYWFGETSDTLVFNAAEGYYFTESYVDGITSNGNGTINATLVDDTTLNLTYTFDSTDAGEVMLTLPAATEGFVVNGVTSDATVTASSDNVTGTRYWYGDTSETLVYTAGEGYYFPSDYPDKITSNGTGTVSATLVDEKTVNVTYTFGSAEAGDVTLTLPGATAGFVLNVVPSDTVVTAASGNVTNKRYWYGDTSETLVYTVAENYYFPSNYTDGISCNGTGTLNAVRVDDSTINITYTFSENETRDVSVVLPSATPIMRDGTGTLTIADVYYGSAINPKLTSDTNSTENISIEYKVAGADDSTYTTSTPVKVGDYTARAVLPQNEFYHEIILTADFSIGFLPVPQNPYNVSGTEGENDYYVTAVTITPTAGYLVAQALDGEYSNNIVIGNSQSAGNIFFMNVTTGEKTDGVWIPSFLIDGIAPVIDAIDGKTYYAQYIEVAVKDTNLKAVLVNGESVSTISEGSTTLRLYSDNGTKDYEITAKDIAGNTKTINIRVSADWVKSGVVPGGASVVLNTNKAYSLGTGNWKVSGDATNYSGNITFYVGKDGEYTFTKQ